MKRSSKPSGSTPGKPAGKANRREGEGQSNNLSSRGSLFNFKPDKVKDCNLKFVCALKRFHLVFLLTWHKIHSIAGRNS